MDSHILLHLTKKKVSCKLTTTFIWGVQKKLKIKSGINNTKQKTRVKRQIGPVRGTTLKKGVLYFKFLPRTCPGDDNVCNSQRFNCQNCRRLMSPTPLESTPRKISIRFSIDSMFFARIVRKSLGKLFH